MAVDRHSISDTVGQQICKTDRTSISTHHPFHRLKIGDQIELKVAFIKRESSSHVVYLSNVDDDEPVLQWKGKSAVKMNHIYSSVITKISPTAITVSLGPTIFTTMSHIDISNAAKTIRHFQRNCFIGQKVLVAVEDITKRGQRLHQMKVTRAGIEDFITSADSKLSELGTIQISSADSLKRGKKVWGEWRRNSNIFIEILNLQASSTFKLVYHTLPPFR